MVSIYSVCTAFIFYNIAILLVFLLRRTTGFLNAYTVSSLLLLTVLGVLRLVLPLDLDFAMVVLSHSVIPFLHRLLEMKIIVEGLTLGRLLLGVWAAGAVFRIALDCVSMYADLRERQSYKPLVHQQAQRIISEFKGQYRVLVSPQVAEPFAAGLFRPVIYLPPLELSDEELRFVLRHEVQHIISGDLYKKLLFMFLAAVFWWNPAARMFVSEADSLIELNCDAKITAGLDRKGRQAYLETILSVLRQLAPQHRERRETLSTALLDKFGDARRFCAARKDRRCDVRQRFNAVLRHEERKPKKLRVLLNCIFIAAFLLSYMIVFEPSAGKSDTEQVYAAELAPEDDFIK